MPGHRPRLSGSRRPASPSASSAQPKLITERSRPPCTVNTRRLGCADGSARGQGPGWPSRSASRSRSWNRAEHSRQQGPSCRCGPSTFAGSTQPGALPQPRLHRWSMQASAGRRRRRVVTSLRHPAAAGAGCCCCCRSCRWQWLQQGGRSSGARLRGCGGCEPEHRRGKRAGQHWFESPPVHPRR